MHDRDDHPLDRAAPVRRVWRFLDRLAAAPAKRRSRGEGMAGHADATSQGSESSSEAFREVRIALVCYGGVSLAIYMHGVTRELHRLVTASSAYDGDQTKHDFAQGSTEQAYWGL